MKKKTKKTHDFRKSVSCKHHEINLFTWNLVHVTWNLFTWNHETECFTKSSWKKKKKKTAWKFCIRLYVGPKFYYFVLCTFMRIFIVVVISLLLNCDVEFIIKRVHTSFNDFNVSYESINIFPYNDGFLKTEDIIWPKIILHLPTLLTNKSKQVWLCF